MKRSAPPRKKLGPRNKEPPLTAIGIYHSTIDRERVEPNEQISQLFRILREEKVRKFGFETTKTYLEGGVEVFAKSSRKYGAAFNQAYASARARGATEAEALKLARKAAVAKRLEGDEAQHRYVLALKRSAQRNGIEVVPLIDVEEAWIGRIGRFIPVLAEMQREHVPQMEGVIRIQSVDPREREIVERIAREAGGKPGALAEIFNALNVLGTLKKYRSAKQKGLSHFAVGAVDAWQLKHLLNVRMRLTASRQDAEQRALESIEDYRKRRRFLEGLEKIARRSPG